MVKIQIFQVRRHPIRIGEARTGILLGVAGNVCGRPNGFPDGIRRAVGSAGAAFALAEVDGDAEAVVAGVLDGLHLAEAETVEAEPEAKKTAAKATTKKAAAPKKAAPKKTTTKKKRSPSRMRSNWSTITV